MGTTQTHTDGTANDGKVLEEVLEIVRAMLEVQLTSGQATLCPRTHADTI